MVCTSRYQLPVVVIIMNNSGIYGGDRRQQQLREAAHKGATAAGFDEDPEPTSFVPNAKSGTPPAFCCRLNTCHDCLNAVQCTVTFTVVDARHPCAVLLVYRSVCL